MQECHPPLNKQKIHIFVAQDITRYGKDLYGELKLVELIGELEKLDCSWIRLLYCYPELVTDELISKIKNSQKVVKYIDIPMQHASDNILKRMNRHVRQQFLQNLIDKLRAQIPNIVIRTTFIVGFPGETEQDFEILYNFVQKNAFDKCGFFAYSREDGTPAYDFENQVADKFNKFKLSIQVLAISCDILSNKIKLFYAIFFNNIFCLRGYFIHWS